MALQEFQESEVDVDHKEMLETKEMVELMEFQESPEKMVPQVLLVPQDEKEMLETVEIWDHTDQLETQDHKEMVDQEV